LKRSKRDAKADGSLGLRVSHLSAPLLECLNGIFGGALTQQPLDFFKRDRHIFSYANCVYTRFA
jgi:hypothetical protein